MMAGSVGRREGQEKLYRFAGVKSQSEPSLGFLSSPAYLHQHPCYGFQRQPRKLRKRSNPAFEFNPSEPVPPLPPLPFLSNPACTPHPHPTQTHPIHNNPSSPPQQQQQPTQPSKNKNFLASIKLFWKSLLVPSLNPHHHQQQHHHTNHNQSTTPPTSFEKQKHKQKDQIWQG
jgi:hypothetical protein